MSRSRSITHSTIHPSNRWMAFAIIGALVLALGTLTACNGATETSTVPPEDVPVVESGSERIIEVEAAIEPFRWHELRTEIAGTVAEVLVNEGDNVTAGDALLRLESEELERAVARAELDLQQAQLTLEKLQQPPDEEEVMRAEHAVDQAAAALQAARLNLTAVSNDPIHHETLEDAQNVYEDKLHKYEARLKLYQSGQEPDYWFVDQAKQDLDEAELYLNRIKQQAAVQLQNAHNEVLKAEQAYQEAQEALAKLQKGPDAHEIEAAKLDIQAAELALEEARDNLEKAVLSAPFDGTVTRLDVDAGDPVSAGQVVLVLATLDRLQARTVDLTELDVARVTVGQPAVLAVDALPDVEISGVVERIGLQAEDYRGDVTYPVIIKLTDPPDTLRWGMTAVVKIQAKAE